VPFRPQNNHDARTMLSLGNMYFANLGSNPERYIKDSYKFFHHVLTKDPKNVYAANGLGIVCAEKGEFDVAREIISRVGSSCMHDL
jgi:RNA polymerase-associated protein CTR9